MPGASISRKLLIKKLRALGYSGPFSRGRHQFMIKGEKKIRIPNPHKGQSIHVGLAENDQIARDINCHMKGRMG